MQAFFFSFIPFQFCCVYVYFILALLYIKQYIPVTSTHSNLHSYLLLIYEVFSTEIHLLSLYGCTCVILPHLKIGVSQLITATSRTEYIG